jgi:hypothetical protein
MAKVCFPRKVGIRSPAWHTKGKKVCAISRTAIAKLEDPRKNGAKGLNASPSPTGAGALNKGGSACKQKVAYQPKPQIVTVLMPRSPAVIRRCYKRRQWRKAGANPKRHQADPNGCKDQGEVGIESNRGKRAPVNQARHCAYTVHHWLEGSMRVGHNWSEGVAR